MNKSILYQDNNNNYKLVYKEGKGHGEDGPDVR